MSWSQDEKISIPSKYGCEILIENGSYAEVCIKDVPNDAHIIKYVVDDKICFDLTRGTKTRLFDMYWDKFRENLKSIGWGHGRISPKMWGNKPPPKTKKKR